MRETFRAWQEQFETFALEVILGDRRDKKATAMRGVLFCLSKVFLIIVKGRRWLYEARIIRDHPLGVQVITVGNLTVGGTGKTPVVEKFARVLTDHGRKVAILSRGYRSNPPPLAQRVKNIFGRKENTPPRVVSDAKSLLLNSEDAGDEPFMLASNLKDVVVLVDKDRVKAGRYAIEQYGCDTLLLDDGFQYWKLAGRRQDIVLIDAQQPFGNEHLLPRGTLREPVPHLARANTIFITKSDGDCNGLRARIRKHNAKAGIIECVHWPLYFEDVFNPEQRENIGWLKGRKVATLSGIAQPESFEQSLVEQGAELVYAKRFADHHRFNQQEILNAINRAKKRRAEVIITTQKDAVRFPKIDRRDLPIYFIRVEIKILAGAKDFEDCVRKICFR
ncbi:MAG TPA: tetraacyldisaccharide 4'-kinase [Verrucomicrobiales bacterium]|jgi:tetraacyldisaccharide 4'-kinase|nr:tetraacyldisaccharide 4'-kinase [Verrucomicrobiales bacterium]|tara:strand:+ start:801 stop:1973 length:1173 start_codon:yes stop_codon:yes gene_type:complete